MQSTLTPINPASYATQVEMLDKSQREAERAKLSQARTLLRDTLATHAPDWNEFKQLVEHLSGQLAITQKAAALSDDVAHLVADNSNSNNDDDGNGNGNRDAATERPRVTMDAMKESQRISSNLDTLARVKKVAECMHVVRSSCEDTGTLQYIIHGNGNRSMSMSCRSFVNAQHVSNNHGVALGSDMRSIQPSNINININMIPANAVPDFVARAKDIANAQAAASDPALRHVDALKPIHEELRAKTTAMFHELQTLLLYGVFGIPLYERANSSGGPKSQADNVSSAGSIFSNSKSINGTASFSLASSYLPLPPKLPRHNSTQALQPSSSLSFISSSANNVPAGFSELPPVVQDTLPQIVQAFDILCANGNGYSNSDDEDSHSCKTLEKIARQKAFSVVEHAIKVESKLFASAALTDTEGEAAAKAEKKLGARGNRGLFVAEHPSNMQKFAAAIVARISHHFLAILQRSSQLAKQQLNIAPAIAEIRRQFVAAFLFVVDTLLGQHKKQHAGLTKKSFHKDTKQDEIAEFWAASPVASILHSYTLNIYNLELMYGTLEAFAQEYERLFSAASTVAVSYSKKKHSKRNITSTNHSLLNTASPLAFYSHINGLIETLIGNLKFDLKCHVKHILGNRAGSLLQPPTLTRRSSSNELSNAAALPASPYMESIALAIAVCIRIAVSIPSAAGIIGEAISIDILNNLNIRSHEALNLAMKWTDAGKLSRYHGGDDDVQAHEYAQGYSKFEGNTNPGNTNIGKLKGRHILRSPSLQQQLQHQVSREEVTKFYARVKSVFYEEENNRSLTLLTINEWKAIIRLIHGLNSLIEAIEKWCSDVKVCEKRGSASPFVPRWSSGMNNTAPAHPPNALDKLRNALGKSNAGQQTKDKNDTGNGSGNGDTHTITINHPAVSTVAAVMKPIEEAVRELQDDVVAPTVNLMKNEVMLRCYWMSTKALEEISDFCDGRRRESLSHDDNINIKRKVASEGASTEGTTRRTSTSSCRIYEFDEYGDRIPQSDVKEGDVFVAKKEQNTELTVAENRMVRLAKFSSQELRDRFTVSKAALNHAQQEDVVAGIDTALAAGIGGIRKKHKHRAVAVACRILLQTLVLEDERLAGECTAEQCRALMYSTGMV